eukprot:g49356.t1
MYHALDDNPGVHRGRGSIRGVLAGLAGLLLMTGARVYHTSSKSSSVGAFVPKQGIEEVMVTYGTSPGALQLIPTGVLSSANTIFLYSQPLPEQLASGAKVWAGWLYGAKVDRTTQLAYATGNPAHIVKGQLLQFDKARFQEKLALADQLLGFTADSRQVARQVSPVVQEDGNSVQAYCYLQSASMPTKDTFTRGDNQLKPAWAGTEGDFTSRVVNALINSPLYSLMKPLARRELIKTAEKNGIGWRDEVKVYQSKVKELEEVKREIENKQLVYPAYYTVPFHAYPTGNLEWLAAFECMSATKSMARRVYPKENMSWQTAQDKLRRGFFDTFAAYLPKRVDSVLDIGCSVGMSTTYLLDWFEERDQQPNMIGLDLSPYFLAVAQYTSGERIQYIHALAEDTKLPSESQDLITMQFMIHELPREATRAILKECYRLLRKGGVLALCDNNPSSPVIRNLPPAIFTLMKSTEPHSDDYYSFNVEEAVIDTGFEWIATSESDPRHRSIVARKTWT